NLDGFVLANAIATNSITNAELQNSSVTVNAGTGLNGGGLVSLGGSTTLNIANAGVGTAQLADAAVTNAKLANSSVTVSAGAGLSGGGPIPLGGATTFSANINHDATLAGNGGNWNLGLNLGNSNTWTGLQSFGTHAALDAADVTSGTLPSARLNGSYAISITGSAASAMNFAGLLAGDVTGTQGATVVSSIGGVATANFARTDQSNSFNETQSV